MKYLKTAILCSISLFLLSWVSPSSQTSLEGKVTQANSGDPILFSSVALYQEGMLVVGTETDLEGKYFFSNIMPGTYDVEASYVGYVKARVNGFKVEAGKTHILDLKLNESEMLSEVVVTEKVVPKVKKDIAASSVTISAEDIKSLPVKNLNEIAATPACPGSKNSSISIRGARTNASTYYIDGIKYKNHNGNPIHHFEPNHDHLVRQNNTESYGKFVENTFKNPRNEALSTFSIDVDKASYSNVRRFLDNGQMPPEDAVRIEEMINYFDYNYAGPKDNHPFAIHNTLVDCPWNEGHQLLHIGIQGERIEYDELPASNLVFLIDVSGSMGSANKLHLVISSFKMLLNKLRDKDRVAIVTYAGRAGVALESTSASEKQKIYDALESLRSGGSTAGAEGILTAYKIAKDNFLKEGNNRVILATDGDFNVGVSNNQDLESLIEKERKSGVFFSILGYGMGNYKDDKMQVLAQKGNGNHAYIDNAMEAKKVLVSEFGGTLFTIAKDVKIQIEFNPAYVQAYRLIGYESRLLNKEDFNNDKIDAGELGAGHTVTAIYEIVPTQVNSDYIGKVDDLNYQKTESAGKENGELATFKLRYKQPDEDTSSRIIETIGNDSNNIDDISDEIRFSLGVAHFGQILRKSKFIRSNNYKLISELCEGKKIHDSEGYKSEFIRLVSTTELLDSKTLVQSK